MLEDYAEQHGIDAMVKKGKKSKQRSWLRSWQRR
jgi:hypothetical protein